ncbi:MAG TPA: AsmA family protein, partial [Candidatus Acidoferrales bacterium]|nr:AsmA family protein [Candidatus Acidoferrales bacterium]
MTGKRIVQWTAILIGSLLVVLLLAAIVVVRTASFQHFVLMQLEQKVQASTGARFEIGKLAINWRLLTLDLYGIVLHGKESGPQAPLFAADHLRVGLKIISILERNVDLNEIVLDQPVAHFTIDRNGNSNLPASNSSTNTSSTMENLLDLAIRHVQLNSGALYYNDAQFPLNADLRDLRADIHFNLIAGAYHGTIGYSDGRLAAESLKPISHRLQLSFTLDRSGLAADPMTVATEQSTLNLRAKLMNFDRPKIDGTYDGVLSTTDLARFLDSKSIPAGKVAASGNLYYESDPKKSAMESAYIDGRLESQELLVEVGQIRAVPKSIRAEFKLEGGNLIVKNAEADLLGGHISAVYELSHIGGNSSSHVHANVRDVSLQAMDQTAGMKNKEARRISGQISGAADATWTSSIQNAMAKAHFDIRNPHTPSVGDRTIPLNGLIDLSYDGAKNTASFGQSFLQTGNTKISISGLLSNRSQLNVQASTSDLHELAALVSTFEIASSTNPNLTQSSLLDLGGSANFTGQISGAVKQPRIQGDLSASNLQVRNARWKTFHATLDAASSGITLQNGELIDPQNGQINFSGHADISAWSFTPTSPLTLQVNARQILISELQQFLQSQYPVTGMVAANISIHGTEQNPQGQGSLQITRANAWNEPIQNLNINFNGDGNSIHSEVKMAIPAGNLAATLSYEPKTQSYEANLNSSGMKLDQLEFVQARNLGLAGDVAVSAQGRGTFQNPQFTANLQIPKLAIRDQTISDVHAELSLANQRATFTLISKADQGSIQAKGIIGLTGDFPAMASLDIWDIPVSLVLARFLTKTQQIQG